MKRKSLLLALAIVFVLVTATATALALLAAHEPAFYVAAAVPSGEEREKSSDRFEGKFATLISSVVDKRKWSEQFTEDEINSYLEEAFLKKHSTERPLPDGVGSPRVSLDTDRVRLGFRYGVDKWSSIVSLDMRVWLVAKETNTVALEFRGMHAGALPISTHSWLEHQVDVIRQRDIEASWYRHEGYPVLLLRFQADRSNPAFRLQELSLRPGLIIITGRRSSDSAARSPTTAFDAR